MSEDKMIKVSLTIPESQQKWLDSHPDINRSQLFRKAISELQSDHVHRVSPILFLTCMMSNIMGIVLIAISFTHYASPQLRLVLAPAGGIMSVLSVLVFLKEKQRIHKKKKGLFK